MFEAFRQANLARQQEEIAERQSQIADGERATGHKERNRAELQRTLVTPRLTASRNTILAVGK